MWCSSGIYLNDARHWYGVLFKNWKDCGKVPNYNYLCESEVILHHLCDNFSLRLWFLGLFSRHGKQNQRFCHLMLQDHAWDKTTRLHIQQCYSFHDQHWASCVFFKEAPAKCPWTHPSSSRGRACKNICFLCTTSWQKEAGTSTHLLHHLHPRGVRISWSWYISRWDSHTCRRSVCMEKSCNRLLRSQRMIMMVHVNTITTTTACIYLKLFYLQMIPRYYIHILIFLPKLI